MSGVPQFHKLAAQSVTFIIILVQCLCVMCQTNDPFTFNSRRRLASLLNEIYLFYTNQNTVFYWIVIELMRVSVDIIDSGNWHTKNDSES